MAKPRKSSKRDVEVRVAAMLASETSKKKPSKKFGDPNYWLNMPHQPIQYESGRLGIAYKPHRREGNKPCPLCLENHSLAQHKSHGLGSFARTHPGK